MYTWRKNHHQLKIKDWSPKIEPVVKAQQGEQNSVSYSKTWWVEVKTQQGKENYIASQYRLIAVLCSGISGYPGTGPVGKNITEPDLELPENLSKF